jgi:DNA-binding NtrC family response regulator/tetratricopeptide (TPR) repeat protein
MLCRCARALHATLKELDQLLARRHFEEALDLATRALGGRLVEPDLAARLRIGRAHALWMGGRVGPARHEAERAMGAPVDPLTRARAEDALALFAWKDAQFADAQALAEGARRVYEARSLRSGLARSLQAEAGLLADRGQLEPALSAQTRRVEALSRVTPERLGEALADRSTLLTLLGRWNEATSDLQRAADVFRRQGEPGVLVLKRAALELSRGHLGASRRLVEQARESERLRPSSPRVLAEACLVGSDVALAGGLAQDAESEGATAIRAFVQLGDRGGECRSRVRRAQSLLALGRCQEAALESGRALKLAISAGAGIEALAQLTLGRAYLRTRPGAAAAAFERAEQAALSRPDLTHAARLGRALASTGPRSSEDVDSALGGLERWGDCRLLAFARAEVKTFRGGRTWVLEPVPAKPPAEARQTRERALVEAALALQEEGDWPLRWARAMRAVRPVVPFARVALLVQEGDSWELREGLDRPTLLPPSDVARDVASRAQGPALFEVRSANEGRERGDRRLAMVAPVNESTSLYAEVGTGRHGDEDGLDLLAGVARVVAVHVPADRATVEAEPPTIPGLVGRSDPMRELLVNIRNAARSEGTIHVHGETGTGKERIARALHEFSPRSRGPFVALNAASLSEELFESQLFGHVRGAFTGAVQDSIGYVGEAEGGTLFLDEVADLSPMSQARLLRFLQEGEYRRLGEPQRLRKANVRVLTAANVSLEELVQKGRFREDLRYRIDAITLMAPPLRTRGDDILLLARHFLSFFATRDKVASPRLGSDAASALRAYSWPGNVRELQGEMQRLVIQVRDRSVRREDLRGPIASASIAPSPRALSEARLILERDHVVAALRRHGGNRARAAADLGITRQALYEKIRRLGLRAAEPTLA